MALFELFGTASCPYTREMREWLEWKRADFVEYDVDQDAAARERMRTLTPNQRAVPVLVQDGKVLEIGWQGRTCVIGAPC